MRDDPRRPAQLAWYAAAALGAAVILGFWWHISGHHTVPTTASLGLATGNATGLIGTYGILWQLVLLSRLSVLERVFGMERLTWLHRWNGYIALIALLAHAVFLTVGYAAVDRTNVIAQFLDFQTAWQDLLSATVALAMLIIIVLISIAIVRRRLKYETWYLVHLTTYIAILLGFSHQLSVGTDFISQPLFQAYWWALYGIAFGLIALYRVIMPCYLYYKHRFIVERVERETPEIVSIYIKARTIGDFHYEAGQFAIWRFLARGLWWQAHPFSISLAPGAGQLRITVKAVGDFTRAIQTVKPGTPVFVDGPHGGFTLTRAASSRRLLIAGGVGITPVRAMLEATPPGEGGTVVLYAVRTPADIALRTELDALIARVGGAIHYLVSASDAPGFDHGHIDAAALKRLVPDAAARDVLLCGPPAMMRAVRAALIERGVNPAHIHTERFAFAP